MSLIFESAHPGRRRFAAAHAVLEQAIRDRAFPGAAYGILLNDEVVALDSAGRFTYDSGSKPVTPSTVFDLASVTKVVATTALAMRLYDRGILSLDARLGDILPEFVAGAAPDSDRNRVTLRSLLAHSSGLPGYVRLFEQHRSPQAMLDALLHLPARSPARHARRILRHRIHAPRQRPRSPLRHSLSSSFKPKSPPRSSSKPRASIRPPNGASEIPPTENDTTFRHRVIQGEVQDENCFALGGVAGHAGLFANALDVLRFAACILDRRTDCRRRATVST